MSLKKYFKKLITRRANKIINAKNLKIRQIQEEKLVQLNNYRYDKFCKYPLNFKHSGKFGDIIYSLPTIKALANKYSNGKADLYIHLGMQPDPLNEKLFDVIYELLKRQPYLNNVKIHQREQIDFDLDIFRLYVPNLVGTDITKFYQFCFPVWIDTCNPWLFVEKNNIASNSILINRTDRYQVKNIDYGFLSDYPSVFFVGLESEFKKIKKNIPNLEYLETKNLYELATIIAGCKLFIGNQSTPFAIAEGLKVPRILESCVDIGNVNPCGGNKPFASFRVQRCLEELTYEFYYRY